MIKKTILSLLIIATLAAASVSAQNTDSVPNKDEISEVARQTKVSLDSSKGDVIVEVNSQPIYQDSLERAKLNYSLTNYDYTEQELINKLIRTEVLRQKAIELGHTVTDEEVVEYIEFLKESIAEDKDSQAFYEVYLEGLGLTLDEYYKLTFESYRIELMTSSLKDAMIEELLLKNSEADYNRLLSEWNLVVEEWIIESEIN